MDAGAVEAVLTITVDEPHSVVELLEDGGIFYHHSPLLDTVPVT